MSGRITLEKASAVDPFDTPTSAEETLDWFDDDGLLTRYDPKTRKHVILESVQLAQLGTPGRGLVDSSARLRTGPALLGVISSGGDIIPSVSDSSVYFDPGHKLTGDNEHEIERCAANLPLHRIGVPPEHILATSSARSRAFVDGVLSNAAEEVSRRKAGSNEGSPADA